MKTQKTSYIFLIILMITLFLQGIYTISSELTFTLIEKLILICIEVLSVIGYTYFINISANKKTKKKNMKRAQIFLFVLYVLNLIYVLFLDPDFGRKSLSYLTTLEEYLKYNVNIEPFASIRLFMNGYQNGYVTIETLLRNILGNFVVFMPMAYFLPLLFKRQRKWIIFFITLLLMITGVEICQVFLRIGSGDIDDLILNLTGVMFMYTCLKVLGMERIYKD